MEEKTALELQQERDKLLTDWQAAKNNMVFWRDKEKKLRDEISAKLYPDPKLGKNIIDLGAGYTAVLTRKQTKGFIIPSNTEYKDVEEAVEAMTGEMGNVGNSGAYHAEKLVKRKFELSETAYRDLPVELQKIADLFIETKNSTPTFEIEAPKGQ